MRHWLEILFAFLVVGCHAATPNLPLYVRPDGTVSGPSNFFTGSFVAGPNVTLTTQRSNLVITSMGSGATVTNIAGGTNISIRATGGTNFIDTTGQLNNWSQIPTNTIPSTTAASSNSLYLAIIANGSLVSNGCVSFTMTTSNNLVSLIGSTTNYHNLNGTNFTSKHATISSNLTITGYSTFGVGGDKMRVFLATNGTDLYLSFYGESGVENLQVDWSSDPGYGISTPLVKANTLYGSNSLEVGTATIKSWQSNHAGIWFTNVTMPRNGSSGFFMSGNTNMILTNGAGFLVVGSNGCVGINEGNPLYPLTVKGLLRMQSSSPIALDAGNAQIDAQIGFRILTYSGGLKERVTIPLASGHVGIGTNIPQSRLHVTGDNSAYNIVQIGTTNRPSLLTIDTNGVLYVQNKIDTGDSYASNYVWKIVRWVDEKFSGLGFGLGASVPARTQIYGGIYGRAFDDNDDGDFSMQFQHGLASSNANFQNLYYDPHIHCSVAALGAGESNATFIMEYQITSVHTNYGVSLLFTNTITMTETNFHYLLDFGPVTNNAFFGKDSVVARGNLKRVPAATGNISARVFVDSLDFHIPVNEYGSQNIDGD